MADFQSFLLQNMQLIGLEDEDDDNDAKTLNTKTTRSSEVSISNSKYSTRESVHIKSPKFGKNKQAKNKLVNQNLMNPSNLTTETFLSSSNLTNGLKNTSSKSNHKLIEEPKIQNKKKNESNVQKHDPDDNSSLSNSSSPKFFYKKSNKLNVDLDDSNNYHLRSIGVFNNKAPLNRKKQDIYNIEPNFANLETQLNYKNYYQRSPSKDSTASNSSTRDLSSPESIMKTDFKSSTPIVIGGSEGFKNSKHQQSIISNNYERVIKSPKPLKNQSNSKLSNNLHISSNESMDYRRVSSQRNNKDKRNAKLDISPDDSITSNMQTSFIASNHKLNDLNNENYDNEDNNFNDDDKTSNNSIESTLMEPYLVKFERELLKNSKSDMIKDFNNFKQKSSIDSLSSKLKKQISDKNSNNNDPTSGHLFQKYIKEIKNLTVRKKNRKEPQIVTTKKSSSLNLLELRKLSKNQIPWNNLDIESADLLLSCIRIDESDDSAEEIIFPDLFSKNGNKISKNQVKRWYEILKSLKEEEMCASTASIALTTTPSSPTKLNSSKKFFMNKKRQILEKVVLSRKKSTTPKTSTKKLSKADNFHYSNCDEVSQSVSKLYANDQIGKSSKKNLKEADSSSSSVLSYSSSSSNSDSESSKTQQNKKNNHEKDDQEEPTQYINDNFNMRFDENLNKINKLQKAKVPPKIPPPPLKQNNNIDPNNFYNEIDSALNVAESKSKNANHKRSKEIIPKGTQSSSAIDLANKENKIKESKQIFEKFFEALEQEEEAAAAAAAAATANAAKQKNAKTNVQKDTTGQTTSSKTSLSKIAQSSSAVSVVPPLPDFSSDVKTGASSSAKMQISSLVKLKGSDLLAKIKSPERKILYNEWFTIIKKMEKDPKFDLEALVRTRGRFTEHDNISYRDRFMESKQLRCARSEPNFSKMQFTQQSGGGGMHDDSKNMKNRNGISKTSSAINKDARLTESQQRVRRNFSASTHDNNEIKGNNQNRDITIKSESFSETIRRKWELEKDQNLDTKQSNQTLSNALKLTLQKSDINFIKEALKKKDKKIITGLTNNRAVNGNRNNLKDSNSGTQTSNDNRLLKTNGFANNDDDNNTESDDEKSTHCNKNIRNTKIISSTTTRKNTNETLKNSSSNRNHSHTQLQLQHKQHRSGPSQSNHLRNKATSKMNEESNIQEGEEHNLMSKCKNLTNIYKSESAKAFRDVKGKIGNKLKLLASNTKLSPSSNKIQSLDGENTVLEKRKHHVDSDNKNRLRHAKEISNKSENVRRKIVNQKPTSEDDEIFDEKEVTKINKVVSSSSNTRVNRSKSKHTTNHDASESPSRPVPPKRPPPPRPLSPSASFSNYSCSSFTESQNQNLIKKSQEENKSRSNVTRKKLNSNFDRTLSNSPQSQTFASKKHVTNNSQLPPRPPLPTSIQASSASKFKYSSNNQDDFLSDCQIYEFEELKLRNVKHSTANSKNLDLIREENPKKKSREDVRREKHHHEEKRHQKITNSSSTTPSLSISQSPSPDLQAGHSRRNISNHQGNHKNKHSDSNVDRRKR